MSRFLDDDSVFRQLVGLAYTAAQKLPHVALELYLNGVIIDRDALNNELQIILRYAVGVQNAVKDLIIPLQNSIASRKLSK